MSEHEWKQLEETEAQVRSRMKPYLRSLYDLAQSAGVDTYALTQEELVYAKELADKISKRAGLLIKN
jgi:hypothetical protein